MRAALVQCVKLVGTFEGCRLKAYRDVVGIWTIGYGETLGVHEGMVWTQAQAEKELSKRLLYFMTAVKRLCPNLNQNQLVACTSLAYNIGLGAFKVSSVRRLINRGEFLAAAEKFLLWNKAGGRVWRGLTLRRMAERDLFLQ